MIRECDFCGFEFDEYWMDKINTGRRQLWICPGCKRNARREADMSEATKKRKRQHKKDHLK